MAKIIIKKTKKYSKLKIDFHGVALWQVAGGGGDGPGLGQANAHGALLWRVDMYTSYLFRQPTTI